MVAKLIHQLGCMVIGKEQQIILFFLLIRIRLFLKDHTGDIEREFDYKKNFYSGGFKKLFDAKSGNFYAISFQGTHSSTLFTRMFVRMSEDWLISFIINDEDPDYVFNKRHYKKI